MFLGAEHWNGFRKKEKRCFDTFVFEKTWSRSLSSVWKRVKTHSSGKSDNFHVIFRFNYPPTFIRQGFRLHTLHANNCTSHYRQIKKLLKSSEQKQKQLTSAENHSNEKRENDNKELGLATFPRIYSHRHQDKNSTRTDNLVIINSKGKNLSRDVCFSYENGF